MTDDAFLEGESMAVHVEPASYDSAGTGPEDENAQYQGEAVKLTSHEDSPAGWIDQQIVGPFSEFAEYVGRSAAIHVFGQAAPPEPPGPIPACDCCLEANCFSGQVLVNPTGGGEIYIVNPGYHFYDSTSLNPPQYFRLYGGATYIVQYFAFSSPETWAITASLGGGTALVDMGGLGYATYGGGYHLVYAQTQFVAPGGAGVPVDATLFMQWMANPGTPQPFVGGASLTGRVFYVSGADPRFVDLGEVCAAPDGTLLWGEPIPDGNEDCESGDCVECDDPTNPGVPIPPFVPGYLPTFRYQIGDPTTTLDSYICTLSAAAMALAWHTRGAVDVWGGQLVPFCGKSEADIAGASGSPGTNLENARIAWLHWSQVLDGRSGETFDDLMYALSEGRAAILQGDYDQFTSAESCQPGFDENHAVTIFPYQSGDRLLIGDPLCNGFYGRRITSLRAYAEDLGRQVFGVTSPQKILFAVTRPWAA